MKSLEPESKSLPSLLSSRLLFWAVAATFYLIFIAMLSSIAAAKLDQVSMRAATIQVRPGISVFSNTDVIFYFVSFSIFFIATRNIALERLLLAVFFFMLITPVLFNLAVDVFWNKIQSTSYIWTQCASYMVESTGAVGATIGLISSISMFPILLLMFKVSSKVWPRFSLYGLVLIVLCIGAGGVLATSYLQTFVGKKWEFLWTG